MEIKAFWDAVLRQDADAIREYFHPDAWVNWHNTNEHFTVEELSGRTANTPANGTARWSRSLPPTPISLLPPMCSVRTAASPAMPLPSFVWWIIG